MGTESGTPTAGVAAGADPDRAAGPGGRVLEADLHRDPTAFAFFQAVRLLQRLRPDRGRVGGFARPEDEVVRFTVNSALAFPAGEVQDLRATDEEDAPPRMEVNFMGLVGHQGVLPEHYSLLASGERGRDERPLTDFLDMFQHRLLSLFYAAWERGRFWVPFERGDGDRVSARLRELIGLGSERLQRRMSLRDEAFLFYVGLLATRQRGAAALRQLLEDYFEVPVEVEQFVGGWYGLAEDSYCRLEEDPAPGGVGLGEGAVVGDEFWDPQARVRIRVGPVGGARYREFLPGGSAHRALKAIVRFFGDEQFDFELQLVMAREDVPGLVLGRRPAHEREPGEAEPAEPEPEPGETAPLGWCTWIRTRPREADADETTLSL